MMKRIYVAGRYSADNVLDVLRNIGRGEKMCAKLFKMGYAPYCPWHDKTYVMENQDTEILGSLKFAKNRLNTTQNTNTGHNSITFNRPIVSGKDILISAGSYDSVYDPKEGVTTLSQNNVARYKYGRDENGKNIIVTIPEK